jgi:hypothetical protein
LYALSNCLRPLRHFFLIGIVKLEVVGFDGPFELRFFLIVLF